ncbi:MAG: cation:proton antiporter [Patescibacteria group bacterium]
MSALLELTVITLLATAIAFLLQAVRQPLVVAYIVAGIIAGPFLFNVIQSYDALQLFSKIGIIMLLYIVGLGLRPQALRSVGRISVITGLGQVIFTSVIGFGLATALGLAMLEAFYVAVALTFSSTIIILKLLSDRGDTHKLYGQIAIGFLLVQDIVATLALVFISTATSQQGMSYEQLIGVTALKGAGLTLAAYLASRFVLPPLTRLAAKSQELLFLLSISWGLGIASVFYLADFSVEVGALIAGIAFASSPYATEVASRMRPLRDFFIVLFFILLGAQMNIGDVLAELPLALVLSVFVLVGNPIVVYWLMTRLGYSSRIGFQAGLTVAQISEFSLILVALGHEVGHLSDNIVSLVTLVGLITIAGSTYMITYSDQLYRFLSRRIRFRHPSPQQSEREQENEAILFGYHRVGHQFFHTLNEKGFRVTVIDFDPEVIRKLELRGVDCRYGDATDVEFLQDIGVGSARIVVSTLPDFESNLLLVKTVRQNNKNAVVMALSHSVAQTEALYRHGASYALMPHYLGAEYASKMIRRFGLDHAKYSRHRSRHLKTLKKQPSVS